MLYFSIKAPRWLSHALCKAALGIAVFGGCGGGPTSPAGVIDTGPGERPSLAQTYRSSGHAAAGDVFVHLFEWKWTDIASECESHLGPDGFKAVQVSPPMEHSVQQSLTWSQRYQPVSYSIDRSRSGTRAEFVDMISRCKSVGVDIYVDAVINHMTNVPSPGIGSNGTAYTKYSYPGLYGQGDFHLPPCTVTNYQSAPNVQDCELLGLPDLNTGLSPVRQKIANYLVSLARLGVAGFRIDAAKHIQQVELDRIVALVNQTLSAEARPLPWFFLEVIGGSGEALGPRDYFGIGYGSGGAADITEFVFKGVGDKFIPLPGQHISQLNPAGPSGNQFSPLAWGLIPGDKAVVFLENHDTQRADGISYREGMAYRLANVWMLAEPYGYPSIMSSYAFDRTSRPGREMGPPSDASGTTNTVSCASSLETATIGQWVCEHRDPHIARMVGFRRMVAGTGQNHWWDNGSNAIAFSRGDKGFVAINRESATVSATIRTGLPTGTYCDVLTGGRNPSACTGTSVVIDEGGLLALSLPSNTAIAIHQGTRR